MELCKRYKLSDDDIYKEVSNEFILEISPLLKNSRILAEFLGLTNADIEAIEIKARPDEVLLSLYILQEWKNKQLVFNGAATYQVLLEDMIKWPDFDRSEAQVCGK